MAVADIARELTLGGGHRRQIQRMKMERVYRSSRKTQRDYTQRGVRKLHKRPKRGKVRPNQKYGQTKEAIQAQKYLKE